MWKYLKRRSDFYAWAVNIFEPYLFRVTPDTYYIIKGRGDFYDCDI